MPLFPCLRKKQVLVSSGVEPLKTTIEDRINSTPPPLHKLNSVLIANVENESPVVWIRNLISLKELHIRDCPLLKSLPTERLNNLKSLTIENCEQLDLPDEEWKGLESLRFR